jgi:zinc and cadmium transporter
MLGMVIASSLAGGLVSVLLASTVLSVSASSMERAMPRLISFSTGTLLGAAFLGMIPHATRALSVHTVAVSILVGVLAFYVLEKLFIWRHCHERECQVHATSGPLLLVGDAVHNFVDGVVIAGAFLESMPLGLAAALSTIAHEIPQELGEFVVYLRSGMSKRRALLLNGATSLTSLLGAILGYFFLPTFRDAGPYLLALAAAGFLYVALADLIPGQRRKASLGATVVDFVLMVAGVGVIALVARGH